MGVNQFREDEAEPRIEQPAFPELEARQRERLARVRRGRSAGHVQQALRRLSEAAAGSENLMPWIVEAVRVRATLGEISDTLRGEWGEFRAAG